MLTSRMARKFEGPLGRCLAGIALLAMTAGCERRQ
jgi:hypothetical protein